MAFTRAGRYSEVVYSAGVLAPGASVSVRLPGTTTLASLWTSAAKTTAASNPVTADSQGNLSFYADPGLYDLFNGSTTVPNVLVPVDVTLPAPVDTYLRTVLDETTAVTRRETLAFQGAGVTVTDDGTNGRTVITIPGGGGSGGGDAYLGNAQTFTAAQTIAPTTVATGSGAVVATAPSSGVKSVLASGPIAIKAAATMPADANLVAGELAIGFDATTGAPKMVVKAKATGGAVTTTNFALGVDWTPLSLQNAGSTLTWAPTINFSTGLSAAYDFSNNRVDVTATGSGGSSLTIQDEGSTLATAATTLNFVGSGVVASGSGTTKTITISGGGGGGDVYLANANVFTNASNTFGPSTLTDSVGVVRINTPSGAAYPKRFLDARVNGVDKFIVWPDGSMGLYDNAALQFNSQLGVLSAIGMAVPGQSALDSLVWSTYNSTDFWVERMRMSNLGALAVSGSLIADSAAKGLVLKSSDGHYWRFTVSTSGVLSAGSDLGTTRPTS